MKMDYALFRLSALSPKRQMFFIAGVCAGFFVYHVYTQIRMVHQSRSLSGITDGASDSFFFQPDHEATLKAVQAADLFKSAPSPFETAKPVLASTPFSASPSPAMTFEVRGTFAGGQNTPSYALIAQPGQQAKGYRAGDLLGGNMKLEAIYADHVTVSDGASTQNIYLKVPR